MLKYAKYIVPAAILLLVLSYFYVDIPLTIWVTEQPSYVLRSGKILSWLISPHVYVLVLPLIFYFYTFGLRKSTYRKELLFLVLAIPIVILSVDILKVIFGKARPALWIHQQIYGFYFFGSSSKYHSFPSGHGCTIGALMGALSCFRPSLTWVYLAIALLLSLLRVFSLNHYLSEAWGGVLIAFYIVYLLYLPYQKVLKRNWLWRII